MRLLFFVPRDLFISSRFREKAGYNEYWGIFMSSPSFKADL